MSECHEYRCDLTECQEAAPLSSARGWLQITELGPLTVHRRDVHFCCWQHLLRYAQQAAVAPDVFNAVPPPSRGPFR